MIRDPFEVYPSTVHLWRALSRAHGLQKPRQELLEDRVFEVFCHMHRRLDATRAMVPKGQWAECRYERLVADPLETMRGIYDGLGLGSFANIEPRLVEVLAKRAGYKPNRFKELGENLGREICARWGGVIDAQGYSRRGFAPEKLS